MGYTTNRMRRLAFKVFAIAMITTPFAPAQADILAFGDSLTQGYGLFDDEGFVPQLKVWLSAQGKDIRIVNGGVSGDTTSGGLARLEWSLTPEIDAMILALGGNDLLRGIDPGLVRANIDGMLEIATTRGISVLLVGMQAPGNYGPEYKADFDAIWPEMASKYNVLMVDSFFVGLGDTDPAKLADLFQSDGIHPNKDGVTRIVEGLGPSVLMMLEGKN